MDTGRDNTHRYTQSCQISVANSTAKPGLGSESWSLLSSTVRGGNETNVWRLSQVRFVYTRRALECPDMRPAYLA